MSSYLDSVAITANSLFTIFCGGVILYLVGIRRLKRHPFYYGWSIGFILYGLQILFRARSFSPFMITLPMVIAFTVMPASTFTLSPRKRNLLYLSSLVLLYAFLILLNRIGVIGGGDLGWYIGSTIFYLPVLLIVIAHRAIFGNCVDKFIIGWSSLFVINFLNPSGGYISDFLSIFSKIVLMSGIISYDFAIITKKIRNELNSPQLKTITSLEDEGGFRLVSFRNGPQSPLHNVSRWIESEVEKNIKKGIETSVIILQDVLPYSTIRSILWKMPEKIRVFMFSQNSSNYNEFTTLKYDLTELGATITEITKRTSEGGGKGDIILVNLSILIHTFGTERVYSFLLNKMGMLRASGTSMFAVFHPETHEEQVANLFRTIADSVIQAR